MAFAFCCRWSPGWNLPRHSLKSRASSPGSAVIRQRRHLVISPTSARRGSRRPRKFDPSRRACRVRGIIHGWAMRQDCSPCRQITRVGVCCSRHFYISLLPSFARWNPPPPPFKNVISSQTFFQLPFFISSKNAELLLMFVDFLFWRFFPTTLIYIYVRITPYRAHLRSAKKTFLPTIPANLKYFFEA